MAMYLAPLNLADLAFVAQDVMDQIAEPVPRR